ncbi:MAG: FAD-dependent oxidoreductase [Chloroflexota bacterium]|nr:FAD-dependent oxidoreductase [Chloroflexota bacterium]
MNQRTEPAKDSADIDRASAVEYADCCIVGGGPAGAVLALLLARQGITVTLLEAHGDFNRDFRGDGLQPSVLDLFGQMGLADRVLAIALARFARFPLHTPSGTLPLADFSRLDAPYPFVTIVPQVRLLELIVQEAQRCPTFRLLMGARVEALLRDETGRVRGVRYRGKTGWHELRTQLVVGADGRSSRLRGLAGLEPMRTASPVDFLWFRLPRQPADPPGGVYVGDGGWIALLNRGADWQVGYSLAKGGYARLRARGLDALRRSVELRVPWLADRTESLRSWHETSLLSVEVCRLRRWYAPGLLLIGDAAHTMSPVGAVGISEAIQDAAVASNVLGPRLRAGEVNETDLAAVQRRREWPVRIVQAYQRLVQACFLASGSGAATNRVRLVLELQARIPILRDLAPRILGRGVGRVRLRLPAASAPPELRRRPV